MAPANTRAIVLMLLLLAAVSTVTSATSQAQHQAGGSAAGNAAAAAAGPAALAEHQGTAYLGPHPEWIHKNDTRWKTCRLRGMSQYFSIHPAALDLEAHPGACGRELSGRPADPSDAFPVTWSFVACDEWGATYPGDPLPPTVPPAAEGTRGQQQQQHEEQQQQQEQQQPSGYKNQAEAAQGLQAGSATAAAGSGTTPLDGALNLQVVAPASTAAAAAGAGAGLPALASITAAAASAPGPEVSAFSATVVPAVPRLGFQLPPAAEATATPAAQPASLLFSAAPAAEPLALPALDLAPGEVLVALLPPQSELLAPTAAEEPAAAVQAAQPVAEPEPPAQPPPVATTLAPAPPAVETVAAERPTTPTAAAAVASAPALEPGPAQASDQAGGAQALQAEGTQAVPAAEPRGEVAPAQAAPTAEPPPPLMQREPDAAPAVEWQAASAEVDADNGAPTLKLAAPPASEVNVDPLVISELVAAAAMMPEEAHEAAASPAQEPSSPPALEPAATAAVTALAAALSPESSPPPVAPATEEAAEASDAAVDLQAGPASVAAPTAVGAAAAASFLLPAGVTAPAPGQEPGGELAGAPPAAEASAAVQEVAEFSVVAAGSLPAAQKQAAPTPASEVAAFVGEAGAPPAAEAAAAAGPAGEGDLPPKGATAAAAAGTSPGPSSPAASPANKAALAAGPCMPPLPPPGASSNSPQLDYLQDEPLQGVMSGTARLGSWGGRSLEAAACGLGGIPPYFQSHLAAAQLSTHSSGAGLCGRCLTAFCSDAAACPAGRSVLVQVLDDCGDCGGSGILLSSAAFRELSGGGGKGPVAVQWQLADCSDQLAGKDVYMHALPGGNEYYQAVTFSNTKQPVTAVSIDRQALTYASNRWTWQPRGPLKLNTTAPLTITLTSNSGNTISAQVAALASQTLTGTQFEAAAAPAG
ncbi:hypothetical protein D9Q98_002750 [Chlorella vulgaris]|uniref:Expansin-like EG45 domain-containing protein n=1 Tax=Chlorella vulgaris TaxID=3077 RepID=A0A9D4TTZ1_CHLVU|nr:hypothetical protein D9Q98_002750 [Chlorella vulgaris]